MGGGGRRSFRLFSNEKNETVKERLPGTVYVSREMKQLSEMRYRSRKGTDKKCPSFIILLPSNLLPVLPTGKTKTKIK